MSNGSEKKAITPRSPLRNVFYTAVLVGASATAVGFGISGLVTAQCSDDRRQETARTASEVQTNKSSALIAAARSGYTEKVKALLAAGADVHARDDYALRAAVLHRQWETVDVLIAAGADVHARDDTALRWAALNGQTETVRLLLAAGADVHAMSDEALRWAALNGHTVTVEVLREHMARQQADQPAPAGHSLKF